MMDFFIYIVKVNVAVILFYGFYCLLFRQDTFFVAKRITLLLILLVSLIYPLIGFTTKIIENPTIPFYVFPEVAVSTQTTISGTSFWDYWPVALLFVYLLVCGILFVRMLVQIGGIIYQIIHSQAVEIQGIKVFNRLGLRMPFPFFSWIVLDMNHYASVELNEVLAHEETHVRQGHSFDTIFSELFCVFNWFNPFVWLTKREIRMNLEFLADRSVLQSGCEPEHYQIHLLRLSYHKAVAKLTNNFNVSLLKKRIFMMNKKETSKFSVLKYALLLPAVVALLFFNGTLQTTQAQTKNTTEKTDSEQVFSQVENPPVFPGGDKALMKYLIENVKYPKEAIEKEIEGLVGVRFVIEKAGNITNIEIVNSVDPLLDAEALRFVQAMPNWIPGKQDGEIVPAYYTLPVMFKLGKKEALGNPTFKIATDGDLGNALVFLDGKEISKKEMDALDPNTVESINVIKNESPGKIIITTKK